MALASPAYQSATTNAGCSTFPYRSCHTGNPSTTGANEASGASYARQSIAWSTSSAGSTPSNTAAVAFSLPAGTYSYLDGQTATSGGQPGLGDAMGTNVTFSAAGTLNFPAGSITELVSG